MNKVYIVLYNGNVSSEGYDTEEKAIEFIEGRSGILRRVCGLSWIWVDEKANLYKIKEINVR